MRSAPDPKSDIHLTTVNSDGSFYTVHIIINRLTKQDNDE